MSALGVQTERYPFLAMTLILSMENVLFHSASAAASFLMMTNINGNIASKTKEGTNLGEYRRKY